MTNVFVDTSAWFAYVRQDDPDHAACKAALAAHPTGRITSNFVFDELVTLLRYRFNHGVAVKTGNILRAAPELEIVRILPEDEIAAWKLFSRDHDKEYSYTDCTSFALMRRLGLDLAISTDNYFRQAGFRVEPKA